MCECKLLTRHARHGPQVERAEKEWEEADERAKKLEEEARQARCTLTVPGALRLEPCGDT